MQITYQSIGTIFTPFKAKGGMPIQSSGANGATGKVVLGEAFVKGIKDLEGFSHIMLLYHFHQSSGYKLTPTPFMDNTERGVFSTRAPRRPNGIGLSVVEILEVDKNTIHVRNVDMLNETPLLDIKPYVPDFDVFRVRKVGWLEKKTDRLNKTRSDQRFS